MFLQGIHYSPAMKNFFVNIRIKEELLSNDIHVTRKLVHTFGLFWYLEWYMSWILLLQVYCITAAQSHFFHL